MDGASAMPEETRKAEHVLRFFLSLFTDRHTQRKAALLLKLKKKKSLLLMALIIITLQTAFCTESSPPCQD
jgi:hypothetical protein